MKAVEIQLAYKRGRYLQRLEYAFIVSRKEEVSLRYFLYCCARILVTMYYIYNNNNNDQVYKSAEILRAWQSATVMFCRCLSECIFAVVNMFCFYFQFSIKVCVFVFNS